MEFWEDLISSRNEEELNELIPLFVVDGIFAFEEDNEDIDIIQEILIDNEINSAL